jgi:hypothetical protein
MVYDFIRKRMPLSEQKDLKILPNNMNKNLPELLVFIERTP